MDKNLLIGHTGFVGANLFDQHQFQYTCNSKNYLDIVNRDYDLIVCAGISSLMWFANQHPDKDLDYINKLLDVLKTVTAKNFVLISSIAVYSAPVDNVDELSENYEVSHPYGKNRRYVEEVITKYFKNCDIIRLPALFGNHLKKNFIYDLINPIPKWIPGIKFSEMIGKLDENDQKIFIDNYTKDRTGLYALNLDADELALNRLEALLKRLHFSTWCFTHSDSQFQFYDLSNLWKDITIARTNHLKLVNIATEPLTAKEIVKHFYGIEFVNHTELPPFYYDMKSRYSSFYGQTGDYLYTKEEVLNQLGCFLQKHIKKISPNHNSLEITK